MSRLLKSMLLAPRGISTRLVYRKDANILGIGQLCSSVPIEKLTVSLASAYSVSVLLIELVISPEEAGISLCTLVSSVLTATPTSAYNLSTAVT